MSPLAGFFVALGIAAAFIGVCVVGAVLTRVLAPRATFAVLRLARWLDTRHQRRADVRAVRERGQAWTREQARR